MDANIATRKSASQIQICSIETIDQALEFAQVNCPVDSAHNWQKSEINPVVCPEHAERTHFIFNKS